MSKKIQLTARSENPFVQVFLMDSNLKLLDKAIGTLKGNYTPGLYKIKFKAGDNIHEELISLEPDTEYKNINAPEMLNYSSIPLPGIVKNQAEISFMREISSMNNSANILHSLLVFLRSDEGDFDFRSQFKSIKILNSDKREMSTALGYRQMKSAAAVNIPLEPGYYTLRYKNRKKDQELEQTITIHEGWQTQLFITCQDEELDLFSSSLSMSKDQHDSIDELKQCELARIALSNNAAIISEQETMSMLYGKFQNPMLGIYGAHLLLLKENVETKKELLGIVFDNLCRLLGKHPDVIIIGLWLKRNYSDLPLRNAHLIEGYRFNSPPLLLNNWRILLTLSNQDDFLIPKNSIADKVAGNTFTKGPWLIWKTEKRVNRDTISFSKRISNPNRNYSYTLSDELFINTDFLKIKGADEYNNAFIVLAKKLPIVFAFLLNNRDYNNISGVNFSSQEISLLKYLDHILPVDYLSKLYNLKNNELPEAEKSYVISMIKFINRRTIELFRDSVNYANKKNSNKLLDVIKWLSSSSYSVSESNEDLFDKNDMSVALSLPYVTLQRSIKSMLDKIDDNMGPMGFETKRIPVNITP